LRRVLVIDATEQLSLRIEELVRASEGSTVVVTARERETARELRRRFRSLPQVSILEKSLEALEPKWFDLVLWRVAPGPIEPLSAKRSLTHLARFIGDQGTLVIELESGEEGDVMIPIARSCRLKFLKRESLLQCLSATGHGGPMGVRLVFGTVFPSELRSGV
jgi:hypothetical protein